MPGSAGAWPMSASSSVRCVSRRSRGSRRSTMRVGASGTALIRTPRCSSSPLNDWRCRSSATCTATAVPDSIRSSGSPSAGRAAGGAGKVNRKREPWPGVLSQDRFPPISCASCREIVSPSPVPPYSRVVDPSAWVKASNRLPNALASIPMPVSTTPSSSCGACASAPGSIRPSMVTQPSCVNFTALPTRFSSTWRNRAGSICAT